MSYTTEAFLEQVKLLASLPSGRYEDEEILATAYDQLTSTVIPLILGVKEEFYVASETQAVIAGQSAYPIPYRALGLTLREVKLIRGTEIVDLARIDPTEIRTTEAGTPWAFYLEGLDVVLYPTPNLADGALKLSYFQAPSRPVLVSEAAQIVDIDRAAGVITAAVPTSWTTADTFDFVSRRNGHRSLGQDIVATDVSASTSLTVATGDIPSSLSVGDYVALAGESVYFQMPDNCYRLLIQLTANEFLGSMDALPALQAGQAMAQKLEVIVRSQLSTRVQGAPKRLRITL